MKMTSDQLRSMALRHGGTAVIDGKVFNSERAKVTPPPITAAPPPPVSLSSPPAAVAPPPIAPQADTFTRTEVELLLAEQAKNFERRIADVLAETEYEDLAASFTPKYDADGRILTVDVRYHPLQ